MGSEWFYQNDGEWRGPFSAKNLRDLADVGVINESTLVRKGIDGKAASATSVKGLFNPNSPPNPTSISEQGESNERQLESSGEKNTNESFIDALDTVALVLYFLAAVCVISCVGAILAIPFFFGGLAVSLYSQELKKDIPKYIEFEKLRLETKRRSEEIKADGDAQIVCPHCHKKGGVTTETVQRKKGISGGKATAAVLTGGISILATGLSRKEQNTKCSCSNCRCVWHIE